MLFADNMRRSRLLAIKEDVAYWIGTSARLLHFRTGALRSSGAHLVQQLVTALARAAVPVRLATSALRCALSHFAHVLAVPAAFLLARLTCLSIANRSWRLAAAERCMSGN